MSTIEAVEPRESRLGGDTQPRGLWGFRSKWTLILTLIAVVVGMILLVATQSLVLAIVEALVAVTVMVVRRLRTAADDSVTDLLVDMVRTRVAKRTGVDVFEPGPVPGLALARVPREVGSIECSAVAPGAGRPAMSVIRHGTAYFSSVLEVVGGGDGLREVRETNVAGRRFGRFLHAVARAELPVDQIDLMTRCTGVDPAQYEQWLAENIDPTAPPVLRRNLDMLAQQVPDAGEAYRTFMTVCMPIDALVRSAARRGKTQNQENRDVLAQEALRVTGRVAQEAARNGLSVRMALTPQRVGGLIRHLYAPDVSIDDYADLAGPRDGFVAYDAATFKDAVVTTSPTGQQWFHATASIPRDGWPLRPVGVRWLEDLVMGVVPSTIRTVSTQHRLVPKAVMRREAHASLTMDEAALLGQEKRGETSTGEKEAQAEGTSLLLHDLLYEGAAGDRVAVRVTVSAPSILELRLARERITSVAQDSEINRLVWHDTRQHHGHLLTLPLGRGLRR